VNVCCVGVPRGSGSVDGARQESPGVFVEISTPVGVVSVVVGGCRWWRSQGVGSGVVVAQSVGLVVERRCCDGGVDEDLNPGPDAAVGGNHDRSFKYRGTQPETALKPRRRPAASSRIRRFSTTRA
jgi:hypothetical protein